MEREGDTEEEKRWEEAGKGCLRHRLGSFSASVSPLKPPGLFGEPCWEQPWETAITGWLSREDTGCPRPLRSLAGEFTRQLQSSSSCTIHRQTPALRPEDSGGSGPGGAGCPQGGEGLRLWDLGKGRSKLGAHGDFLFTLTSIPGSGSSR